MKLIHTSRQFIGGNTIFLALVMTALVGLVLACYLNLVHSQNYSTMRSQAWNSSIPIVEAGLEEALSHLNTHGSTNLLCDGWTFTFGKYVMQRSIGSNYYVVSITNFVSGATNLAPVIESRGFVVLPVLTASGAGPVFATAGVAQPVSQFMGRGVRVNTRLDFIFTKGMVAKDQIDMNGNNISSNSFDSSDPNYSTGGAYDPSKVKDNGDIATNSTLTNSVNVGNANIYGKVTTGPNGTVAVGNQGAVGSKAWQNAGNKGVQPGWVDDDMNVDFPEVKLPFNGGYFAPGSGTVNGTNYDYVLTGGNYQMSSLSMSSSAKMYITGDAVLYVTGDFSMTGQSSIQLASGASLKLYVGGASGAIGGNGIVNSGNSSKFIYYGLPSNTRLSFDGNATFTGVIYAPNAAFALNGGGNRGRDYTYDFIGASVTKSVRLNGHYSFHYDEALAKTGPFRSYIINGWNEMTPEEVAAVPVIYHNYY